MAVPMTNANSSADQSNESSAASAKQNPTNNGSEPIPIDDELLKGFSTEGYQSNPMYQMESKYQTESQDMQQRSKDGIQVFKQHHQPNFSRVTEKEAEEEDDSLDEKW